MKINEQHRKNFEVVSFQLLCKQLETNYFKIELVKACHGDARSIRLHYHSEEKTVRKLPCRPQRLVLTCDFDILKVAGIRWKRLKTIISQADGCDDDDGRICSTEAT